MEGMAEQGYFLFFLSQQHSLNHFLPFTASNDYVIILSRCDSIEKLKAQLPRMEQELKDQGKFKDFYQFTFNFAKNPGQKGLGMFWVHSHLLL